MYKKQKINLRASLGLNDIPDLRTSNTFNTNSFTKDKPVYQSSTTKQFYQQRIMTLSDKRIIKQIIRKLSTQQSNPKEKEETISRLIAFLAEVDDLEAENKNLNIQLGNCKEQINTIRGQVRIYSNTIKQKDNTMLTLKGKLYQKDQSLRALNSKLNQIIQAIQMTPMQQRSSINQVSRLIRQQDEDFQNSFSVQQSSELCMKIASLESQNKKYIERIYTLERLLTDRKNSNKSDELHRIINELATERNQLQSKLIKSHQQIAKLQNSFQHVQKQRVKVEVCSIDELEQLRASIRNLQEERFLKNKQIQKLQIRVKLLDSELQETKQLIMQRLQQITSLKMELKLAQDILQVQVDSNKQKNTSKSALHKQMMGKLIQQNQSLKQQVESLHKSLRVLSLNKSQDDIQCTSIVTQSYPAPTSTIESKYLQLQIADILKKNNYLQSKVQQYTLQQSRYQNEIYKLKEVVSELQDKSALRQNQNANLYIQIDQLKRRQSIGMDSDLSQYVKKLQQYETIVFPSLYKELEMEKKSRIMSNQSTLITQNP